jgi:hypothetical protein
LRYGFSQTFGVSAEAAYRWCTDYQPDDWARMGEKGTRDIEWLNEDTVILTDTVMGLEGKTTKQRLVRLYPERLAWTNTHLAGPNRHSQFWYQVTPVGQRASRLDFTGLQINYGRAPSAARIAARARKLADEDSKAWILLAKEMKKDLRREWR